MVLSDLETVVRPNSSSCHRLSYDSSSDNKYCVVLCCKGFLEAACFHETFCISKPNSSSSARDGIAPTTENSKGVSNLTATTRGCDIRTKFGSLSPLCKCCAAVHCRGLITLPCPFGSADSHETTICISKPTSSDRDGVGISRSKRDLPPADYLFEIKSYSLSMDIDVEKYESKTFKAGGYTWKLILYPYGNLKSNGKGHVSLYLAIANTEKFSQNWEVNVNFKLFVFDHKNNNYLTIQDADGAVRKFNEMKNEWGFEQLISLEALFDSCNGYFVNNTCIFGAEVFVIGNSRKRETISMVVKEPPPTNGSFIWKFDNFSPALNSSYTSKTFTFGGREWKLLVWLNRNVGDGNRPGIYLSLFLELIDCEKFPSTIVTASFKLTILNQLHNKYYDKQANNCKFLDSQTQWGYSKFISLSDLNEVGKGYIKQNVIIMEVEIFKIDVINEAESKETEKGCIKEPKIIIEPPTYGNSSIRFENLSTFELNKTYTDTQGDWNVLVSTILADADGINGKHVTVYLQPKDWKRFPPNTGVNASVKFKLLDQLRNNRYYEKTETKRYYSEAWSCTNLISLGDFNRAENGYIKNNAITMEIEISNITIIYP